MKTNIKTIITGLALLVVTSAFAQEEETLTIPLSNPNKAGFLKLGIINGSITVVGYEGKEVIIKGKKREGGKHRSKRHNNKTNREASSQWLIANSSN